MNIDLNCPACATRLRVRAGADGRKLRCPKCGVPFQIPTKNYSSVQAPLGVPETTDPIGERPELSAEPFQFQEEPNRNWVVEPRGEGASDSEASLKNWLIVGFLLIVIVAVGLGAVGLGIKAGSGGLSRSGSESRLTKENFLKIHLGMPREDVMLILGQPTKQDYVSVPFKSQQYPGYMKTYQTWEKGGKRIEIECTSSGDSTVLLVTKKEQHGLD